MEFTMKELIECAAREYGIRKRVYPVWVRKGKMKEEVAEREIKMMHSIIVMLGVCKKKLEEDVEADKGLF